MSPAELLAVLDPSDAAALRRLMASVGLDVDEDALPPAFTGQLELWAAFALASGMPEDTPRETRVEAACSALGLNAGTVMKRWYRAQARAAGHFVSRADAAA